MEQGLVENVHKETQKIYGMLVVDVMMIGVMVWSAWKRGACRPGHLVEDLSMDQGDYQPPRILDDERRQDIAAENERLREQLQQLREQHAIETEQLRVESEQSKAEVAELRRQLEEDSKQ